jgi:pSer/pThr/pTyr-binding forkhead associated (FHA) protein
MPQSKNIVLYKTFIQPKEVGIHYRVMCLTGASKGETYYLKNDRIVMGRGEDSDIVISDLKSSRNHAELKKVNQSYFLTDLGSQNGVIVNDLKVTQCQLNDGDKIVIGQTVYKYNIINIQEKGLEIGSVSNKKSQVSSLDRQFNDDSQDSKEKAPPKNKAIVILVTLGGLLYFLLDSQEKSLKEEKDEKVRKDSPQEISKEFSMLGKGKKGIESDKEIEEKLRTIFQRGLRESREGNYFRAITEFNLALILSPQNARASFYLNRTMQILDEEIKNHFLQGRRYFESLKYEQAKNSYCSIVRLLQNFQDDERLKTAFENIKETEVKLGLDEGSITCF